MKKLLLSLLGVLLTGLSAGAANEAISDWGTKADTNYSSRTNSTNEWSATNCALVSVDGLICPTLNGKTSAIGTLTSPELTDGIGTLSISATNTYSENKGISLKAEIKQNGATVASHDFTISSINKNEVFTDTWTGINVSGNFTIVITNNCPSNSTSNKDRASITSLTWTNYSYNPNAPEDVEISYDLEGTTANVTLSCVTEGATIYYGFASDDITNEYSAPFAVTENCTVYAFAQKDEENSSITSLPITVPYTSFKKVIDTAANDEELSIIGNFSVLYQSGSYLILTDGTSNLLVYDNEIPDYEAGTNISEISGKVYDYKNLMEIVNVTLTEGGEGATYTPLKSITGVNYNDNLFDQVEIEDCTIDGKSTDGKSATIKVGEEETIALYNNFGLTYENGAGYTITGFIWRYNDNLQLCPSAITGGEVLENVEAPVIKPNTKELQPDQKVSIECATDGATIYYTIDGTEPTNASTKYEGEFSVEGDVTIKAIAFYEGDDKEMLPSEVVERTYHVWDPYCNVIDNTHETSNKGQYVQHTCTIDGVDYAMLGIHHATQGIQMNNSTSRTCYIIQTGDNVGYVLKSIEVDFNSNTNNITFTVRGSNTPFSDGVGEGAEPNNITTNGDVIGTISNTNTTVEFTKDYDYFAFYPSKNGVVYMNSVTVNYRDVKELDMTEVPSLEGFEIINVDGDMVTENVPTHPNWVTKYSINDGEIIEFDPEENEYITVKAEDLDDATLHTIKIWYENFYHGTKSDENVFNHLTNPKVSENFDEGKTQFNFGTIGEGVKVYFTINGQNPTIETSTPANVIRRAKTVNGIYTIDSDEDKDATHSVSASNTIVEIDPTLLGDTYTIKAQAVHADTNTLSEVITQQGETTSIVELKGIGSEKAVYDLMGRKVQRPAHGIYIQEGVKVRL